MDNTHILSMADVAVIGCRLKLILLVGLLSLGSAYECIEKCGGDGAVTPVSPAPSDANCLISLPDNPSRHKGRTLPCQMDIRSNCTNFCHVEITFNKFHLHQCSRNATVASGHCGMVESCEYVILEETGKDPDGGEYNVVTHFDGDLTSQKYRSRTDRVLLHFCYRSETFSGRNIQLEYRAVDPSTENQLYIGPVSVYVLGCLVIVLSIAICVIRWSPWVRPCLDAPPTPPPKKKPKKSDSFDL